MPNTAIYINGQKIDLAEAMVAVTFQVNDVAELEDRQSNFTNEIKVPFTANNKAILENAELPESAGTSTKNKLPAKIVVDGVEIVSGGFALIESADTHYNITIYSGIAGFFEALGDTGLQDLDLSEWVLEWNLGAVKFLLQNKPTNGYLHAVFEYGQAITNNNELYPPHLLPMFYVHTLVAKIFSSVSQLYESSFFDSAFFKSLALPLFGKGTNQRERDKLQASTYGSKGTTNGELGDYLGSNDSRPMFFGFDVLTNVTNSYYLNVQALSITNTFYRITNGYKVSLEGNYTIRFSGSITANLKPYNSADNAELYLPDCNPIPNSAIDTEYLPRPLYVLAINPAISEKLYPVLDGTVSFVGGNTVSFDVEMTIYAEAGTYFVPGFAIGFCETASATFTFEVECEAEETTYNWWYPIEPNLPSLSCKDFLKNLAKMFALVFYQNPFSGKMEVRRFDEIYENLPYAKDWSDKLDERKGKSIDFEIGGYGQRNRLTYKGDDYVPERLNDGYFTIQGNRYEAEKTVVELDFAACNGGGVSFSNKDIPHVKVFDDSDNIPTNINGRIVSIYDHTLTSTATLDDGIVSPTTIPAGQSVPISRFNQWEGNPNLAFKNANSNNLTDTYYAGIARMLNKGKKVTAYFDLTMADISELNHFIPVYVRGLGANHYYINRVVDFVPGQLTKVELIQL